MKINNRKGFNFYRSYYDVLQELPEQDQLAFLRAIIDLQFTGQEPTSLTGMAKFAYKSQEYSLLQQIKGYNDWLKRGKNDPAAPPAAGAGEGPAAPPAAQVEVEVEEKGEEKEEEKGEVEVDLKDFEQQRLQVIETMKRATHPKWHEDEYIEQAGQLLLKYPGKKPSKIIGLINTWCNNYKPKTGNKSIHQQRPQDQW